MGERPGDSGICLRLSVMDGRRILISPLNWGLGHAGRMIPLALELRNRGHEVIFGVDRSIIPVIEKDLPGIKIIELSGVGIRYSAVLPQFISIFLQLPRIVAAAFREHSALKSLAFELKPDIIISDNRFGFFHKEIFSVFVTHQLRIPFPKGMRFLEPAAAWLNRKIIGNFDLCLVPDYPGNENLSGRLSHQLKLPENVFYMGPLSRFSGASAGGAFMGDSDLGEADLGESNLKETDMGEAYMRKSDMGKPYLGESKINLPHPYWCLILSGPEPQRSLLFEKVTEALSGIRLVILCGSPAPRCRKNPDNITGAMDPGNITVITDPDTATMEKIITGSSLVISRAGYSSIMELVSLGKGGVIIPTPGQTEQEYLGQYHNGRHGFTTLKQKDLAHLREISPEAQGAHSPSFPETSALQEEAVRLLFEQNNKS
ncbi:MAG: glycosyltransferase [Bacteroidales bacterium]